MDGHRLRGSDQAMTARSLTAWVLALLLAATPAIAGSGTITVKDGNGTLQTFDVVTDGSGNFVAKSVLCDQSAAANCAGVTAAHALQVDGSGVTQPVSGTVTANAGTGTFTVSGTVTANAGTNLNTSSLALDTSVNGILAAQGSTTSGQSGPLVQGAVTTSAPTYSTGKTDPLSIDTSGNLRTHDSGTVTVSGTVTTTPPSNATTNVTQFGGTNVSTGTGTGGAGIPRVTVSNDSNVLATQSGTWTVQQGGAPWSVSQSGTWNIGTLTTITNAVSVTGAATPSDAFANPTTAITGWSLGGGWDATNSQWRRLQVDTGTGTLKVDPGTVTVTGTVTTTPPSNATTNVTQFGGVNVSTGTGASGTGIPRVTISNDSSLAANQSTNVAQFGGTNVVTGTGVAGSGVPRVTVSNDSNVLATQSGTWTVQQGGSPWTVVGNATPSDAVSNPTNAVPSEALNEGWDATNSQWRRLQVDTGTGTLKVDPGTVTVTGTVAATQSGTWTVQPGNTPNTSPWLFSINQGGNTAAVNASSQLSTNCANCLQQDATSFTFGTTSFEPAGGVYSTSITALASGQAGSAALTAMRAEQANLRNSYGQEVGSVVSGQPTIPLVVTAVTPMVPPTPSVPSRAGPPLLPNMLKGPGQSPTTADLASVVAISPNPSSACPFIANVNQTGSATIITGQPGLRVVICGGLLVTAAQQGVTFAEGTGSTCASAETFLFGGTGGTMQFSANGGFSSFQNVPAFELQKLGDNFCVVQSGSGNVSGGFTYGFANS
jgi:hypothetical protein